MPSAGPPEAGSSSLAPSKPFSLSLSKPKLGKPTPKPTSALAANRKRPHSALADPDSDPEDDTNGRHEAVLGFGDNGKAISVADESKKKQPLVIKAEKNRDWREESRRRKKGKNLLPAEVQAQQQNGTQAATGTVDRNEVSTEAGLKIAQPKAKIDSEGDTPMADGGQDQDAKPRSADEEAIAALLGEQKKSTLTIPSAEGKVPETNGHETLDNFQNESDRFRADVESRPPPASLEDYAAVPVEEFGAAILRGLGWKEGEAVGKGGKAAVAPREVKRRPALLGIGAKETPGGVPVEELGAWNQKKGKGREKVAYNPVMLRNSVTGEMVTEEEMELRKLEAKQGKGRNGREDDWRERRDRNLKIDEGRKEERRAKDMGRLAIENGGERTGAGSSKRDRSDNRDRDRERDSGRERRGHRDYVSSRKARSRSRSRESSRHGSSKRERSRSMERKHGRRDDDNYGRRDRDTGDRRDKDRDFERRNRDRDYDQHSRDRDSRRH